LHLLKHKRLLLLSLILLVGLVTLWSIRRDQAPDWTQPLKVVIYPHAADDSASVHRFIDSLGDEFVARIERYFSDQAQGHNLPVSPPFTFEMAAPLASAPQAPPAAGRLARLRWGLSLRWWRWRLDTQGLDPDIVVVARFNAIDEVPASLHSVGMAELRLAVANLPAAESHRGYAQVLLAHEILHTVGATDLYDLATGLPQFPAGYAAPNQDPRYPQAKAELMAGRIPVAPGRAVQAMTLDHTRIGHRTAREIGWLGD